MPAVNVPKPVGAAAAVLSQETLLRRDDFVASCVAFVASPGAGSAAAGSGDRPELGGLSCESSCRLLSLSWPLPLSPAWPTAAQETAQALAWAGPVPVPLMAVGPCQKPPVLDGKFEPGEWDDACAISTLSHHGGAYAFPSALVYFTYDAQRVYFGYLRYKQRRRWSRPRAASRFLNVPGPAHRAVPLPAGPRHGQGAGLPVLHQRLWGGVRHPERSGLRSKPRRATTRGSSSRPPRRRRPSA